MGKFLNKEGITHLVTSLIKTKILAVNSDILEQDVPGWYSFASQSTVSNYLGFPASVSTTTAATSFLMYVSPPTLGGIKLRLLFKQNKLSESDVWYNMISTHWYKLDMGSITTKDYATT